jgi:hypothetical protein
MRASIGEGEGIVVDGAHAVTHSQFLGVVIGAPARGVHRRGLAASPLRTGHFARNTIAVMTDSASRHDARQHAAKSIVAHHRCKQGICHDPRWGHAVLQAL